VNVTQRSGSRLAAATGIVDDLSFALRDVRVLDVALRTTEIEVAAHNGNDIRITYTPPANADFNQPLYDFNPITGRLEIFPEYRNFSWVGVGINFQNDKLTIYLPRGMGDALDELNLASATGRVSVTYSGVVAKNAAISSTTGRVNLNDFETSGNLNATATTGRMSLNRITAQNLTTGSTTGRIEATDVTAGDRARINSTTGGVQVTNLQVAGDAEFRSTTGRVNLDRVTAEGNVSATATTGRVGLDNVTARGNMTANTTTGSIKAEYLTALRDLSLWAASGSVNLSSSKVDGLLSVRTSTGTINLNRVDTDMDRADISANRNTRVNIR
jgi:DUF4097 and DUF4098 domain-containing protein YvlB